jgi:hypothetical protein
LLGTSQQEYVMPALRSNSRTVILAIILIIALIAAIVMIYDSASPGRTLLGGALLAVIVWTSAQIPLVQLIRETMTNRPRRRFFQLRSQTVQLLAEIRRLNGIAEDEKRGFRDQRTAELEMEAIDTRMRELLAGIREAAGVTSVEDQAEKSEAPGSAEAP